jgi:hypothetical protein
VARDLNLGVNIRGNNRDLVRAVVGSEAALARLKAQQDRNAVASRAQRAHTLELNRALAQQSGLVRNLTGDYVALRRTVLTLGIRGAVTGFAALSAGITDTAGAVGLLAGSLGSFGGAGIAGMGAGALSAAQGFSVLSGALDGVGKAMTTVGEEHEKAVDKLTKPARAFVGEMRGIQKGIQETKLMAQEGLFPGVLKGLEAAKPVVNEIQQAVFDTAQMWGYLAEEAGKAAARNEKGIERVMQRNVITMRDFGEATIYAGEGLINTFVAAEPLIGGMTNDVKRWSKGFRDFTKDNKKGMASFFDDLNESWENWTGIFGNAGESLFNIWDAAQDPMHKMERGIDRTMEKLADWTKDNKYDIEKYFDEALPSAEALAKAVGATVKTFAEIGMDDKAQENFRRIMDGFRTDVLPLVKEFALAFNENLLPSIIDFTGEFIGFIDKAAPGLQLIGKGVAIVVDGLAFVLKYGGEIVQLADDLAGPGGGLVAALVVGTTIIASWKALRREIALTSRLMSSMLGFNPAARPTGADFKQALPFYAKSSFYGGVKSAPGHLVSSASSHMRYGRVGSALGFQQQPLGRYIGQNPRGEVREGVGPAVPIGGRSASGVALPTRYRDENGRWRDGSGRYASAPVGNYMGRDGRVRESGRFASASPAILPYHPMRQTGSGDTTRRPITTRDGSRAWVDTTRSGGPRRQGSPIIKNAGNVGDIERIAREQVQREMGAAKKGIRQGLKGSLKGIVPGMGGAGREAGTMAAWLFGIPLAGAAAKGIIDDHKGRSEKFNLPQTKVRSGPLIGRDLAKLIPGMTETNKLRQFGDTAEKTFEKLKKAGDGPGLNKLADQARKMAAEFPDAASELNKFANAVESASGNANDQFAKMARTGGKHLKTIKNTVVETTVEINGRLGSDTAKGKEALARNFRAAADAIKVSMDAGLISTQTGIREIRKLMRQSLSQFGITGKQADRYLNGKDTVTGKTLPGGGSKTNAATGLLQLGREGSKGPDRIPLNLNGENVIAAQGEQVAVFTRHQRRKLDTILGQQGYGGMRGFFNSNKTPHYMAQGGMVTGDTDYVPAMGSALNRMARKANQPIYVQSGRRTRSEQMYLKAKYGNSRPVAGPNGPHVRGIAADITPGREKFGGMAGQFGLGFTVPSEAWHIQLLNAALAGDDKAAATLKRVMADKSVGGAIRPMVQGALDSVHGAGKSLLDKIAQEQGFGGDGDIKMGGGGKGTLSKAQIAQLMRRAGWPEDQIRTGVAVALAESGGNTAVQNSIGATGLWQILLSAHPSVSAEEARDPMFATRYALRLWRERGWQPWEAYTKGMHRQFMAMGGPPPRNSGLPNVSVGDAQPGKRPDKNSKSKKKKNPVYPKGKRPGGPYGRELLGSGKRSKEEQKKRKQRINARLRAAKKLGGKGFKIQDLQALVDPITGEDLGLGGFKWIERIQKVRDALPGIEQMLGIMGSQHDLSLEEPIVTLYDSEQYRDLSNYLLAHPEVRGNLSVDQWVEKNGDSLDIVNSAGYNVQGRFVPGINQRVGELMSQLGIVNGKANAKQDPGAMLRDLVGQGAGGGRGGIIENLQYTKALTEFGIDGVPETAIKERRKRLSEMKAMFQANVKVRKSMRKKLKNMDRKGYDWKDAVRDNNDLLDRWRDYKRSGSRLPEGYREDIDRAMERIRNTNEDLRRRKPKGGADSGKRRELNDEYDAATRANRYLVGDGGADSWSVNGGRAAAIALSLETWKEVQTFRDDVYSGVKDGLPTAQLTADQIRQEIALLQSTRVEPRPISRTSTASEFDELRTELLKEKNIQAMQASNLQNGQLGALMGMMPLVAGRMVGSFFRGGAINETGMALVHKGEYIMPDPDGGWRNGMNAPQSIHTSPTVELHIHGDFGGALAHAEARIAGRVVPMVSQQLGKQSRVLAAAPGRR